MSTRTTTDAALAATKAIVKAKKPIVRSKKPPKPSQTLLGPRRNRGPDHEHGRQIFLHHHLQKNMIVYSLTKALRNNAALTQIPFNGKKTVPPALRKDHWHPFAQITFPPGAGLIGLSAFQKLREYRKRHEVEWDASTLYKGVKGGQKVITKKLRGRLLMNQKANSVADIAAVLKRLREKKKPEGSIVNGRRIMPPSIGLKGEGEGVTVEVAWRNIEDAKYARGWSNNVKHGVLPMHTNNRDPSRRGWGFGRLEENPPVEVTSEDTVQLETVPETVSEIQSEKVVL